MLSLILAGGEGARLQKTGKLYPKPLMLFLTEPLINLIIQKIRGSSGSSVGGLRVAAPLEALPMLALRSLTGSVKQA